MHNMLRKLREERAEGDRGFTLIELLVVVVIIGILVAIAIPIYLNYENGAKNKSAESDARNAASVVEQCKADNNGTLDSTNTTGWPSDTAGTGSSAPVALTCNGTTEDVVISSGNTMTITPDYSDGSYTITVKSAANKTYTYDSASGKITSS